MIERRHYSKVITRAMATAFWTIVSGCASIDKPLCDYIIMDIQQGELKMSCAGENVVENAKYYTADKNWRMIFPKENSISYEFSKGPNSVHYASLKGSQVRSDIVFTKLNDGFRIDVKSDAPKGSDVEHSVLDILLSRGLFENATVKIKDKAPLRLCPDKWEDLEFDSMTISTSMGEWIVTGTKSDSVKWKLRSLCGRNWGPPERKTFSIIHWRSDISGAAVQEELSLEMRLLPSPGYGEKMEKAALLKSCSHLLRALKDCGYVPAEDEMPDDYHDRARWLAEKLCETTANINENRLNTQRGLFSPEPKTCRMGNGVFKLPKTVEIACSPAHNAAYDILSGELESLGIGCSNSASSSATADIYIGVPSKEADILSICGKPDIGSQSPEGYIISVAPGRIVVAGNDDIGAFYGVQTLRQMLQSASHEKKELREVFISDYPDTVLRGFFVEGAFSRSNPTQIKELAKNLYSQFKANALIVSLSWRDFKWKSHPELSNPNAFDLTELSDLANYVRRLKMNFIPHISTYNARPLFDSHPEIAEQAPEKWKNKKGDGATYCPSKEETYKLVFDIFAEIVDATKCDTMHIGHDELIGIGTCPLCSKKPAADLFANDVNKIADWLQERGVSTIIWGDMLLDKTKWNPLGVSSTNSLNPEYGNLAIHPAIDKIRKSVIIADWHYDPSKEKPTFKYFSDAGFRVIGCPWYTNLNNFYVAKEVYKAHCLGVLDTDWCFLSSKLPTYCSILGVTCAWNNLSPALESLLWSPEALVTAAVHNKRRPSKRLDSTFTPIPLGQAANKALSGDKNAWFGRGEFLDLSYLPVGKLSLFGIDYMIDRGIVVGAKDNSNSLPQESLPIRIGIKAESLVFLQCLSVESPTVWQKTFGHYLLEFSNGDKLNIPIDNLNSTHWISNAQRRGPTENLACGYTWNSTLAWNACSKAGIPLNIQAFEWINPSPDLEISSVKLLAHENNPDIKLGLVAVTAVNAK